MEKTNLIFEEEKEFTKGGQVCKIKAKVRLDDNCNNGICFIHVTGEEYIKNKYGYLEEYMLGALGNEIKYARMKASKFVFMHGKTIYGYEPNFVENLIYHIKQGNKKYAIKEAMLTEDEYVKLLLAVDEKEYFKYLLFELGIMDRLKAVADKAIKMLEEITGDTWINPYKPEEEKFKVILTTEERTLTEDRIKEGYYTESAILSRKKERRDNKIKAHKDSVLNRFNSVLNRFNKKLKDIETERDIDLAILDCGITCDNYIYYSHTNKLVFNWRDYGDMVSEEEYLNFLANVDRSMLPDNITITYGEK